MSTPFNHENLREQIYLLCEASLRGEIDQSDFERLDQLLRESPDAVRYYEEYISQSVLLGRWAMSGTETENQADVLSPLTDASIGRSDHSTVKKADTVKLDAVKADANLRSHSLPQSSSTTSPLGGDSSTSSVNPSALTSSIYTTWSFSSYIGLFALVVLLGMALVVVSFSKFHQADEPVVASKSDKNPKESADPRVNLVQLDSGSMKVNIEKIGHIVAQGPAEFQLLDPYRARLTRGKVKIHVTEPEAKGRFVVETPDGDVTDLGTTFGLHVSDGKKTSLVVFEGAVDLRRPGDRGHTERLTSGDGVNFGSDGTLDRIVSIVTDDNPAFRYVNDQEQGVEKSIITAVADNLSNSQTRKSYQIVPRGLREDARKYVDRPHEWNGLTKDGMPAYLMGADYVRTFNADRLNKEISIRVTIGQPAKLYIFFDDRLSAPSWLKEAFRNTGDKIGGDSARFGSTLRSAKIGVGPGVNVDAKYSIWEQIISEPGEVVLGSPTVGRNDKDLASMYGIAAVPLEADAKNKPEANTAAVKQFKGK